jgi:hypothetical protein
MRLEEDGEVTVLSWSSSFEARIPFTGGVLTRVMRGAVDRFAEGIKTDAEAQTS